MSERILVKDPVSPYLLKAEEVAALRDEASRLKTELSQLEARGAPWVERDRGERRLKDVQRRLDTHEFELQRQRRRQQVGGDAVHQLAVNGARMTWDQLARIPRETLVALHRRVFGK